MSFRPGDSRPFTCLRQNPDGSRCARAAIPAGLLCPPPPTCSRPLHRFSAFSLIPKDKRNPSSPVLSNHSAMPSLSPPTHRHSPFGTPFSSPSPSLPLRGRLVSGPCLEPPAPRNIRAVPLHAARTPVGFAAVLSVPFPLIPSHHSLLLYEENCRESRRRCPLSVPPPPPAAQTPPPGPPPVGGGLRLWE